VKNDEITLLILPSLFHVAGKNIAQLSDFLAFLEKHQVKLLTLKERIDSDRFSRSQIFFLFVNRTLSFNPNKGLQMANNKSTFVYIRITETDVASGDGELQGRALAQWCTQN